MLGTRVIRAAEMKDSTILLVHWSVFFDQMKYLDSLNDLLNLTGDSEKWNIYAPYVQLDLNISILQDNQVSKWVSK